VVVSLFEWAALGLFLFGIVIPVWLLTIVALRRTKQRNPRERLSFGNNRVMRYNQLMDYLHAACRRARGESQSAAAFVATVRELREYPEYRDLSVLFLEEITVKGTGKFDELAKTEIRQVEEYLLAIKEDAN
jgi:hypothetical protein